jgi:hypothetical protein
MAKAWKPANSQPRELPEEGRHIFRLRGIIDLGTIKDAKFGNQKREVKALFELVETNHVFDKEKGPQPFQLSKVFTFSMSEKSNMRKTWEQWKGKKYTEEELAKFDIWKWIGFPGECVVEHKLSKTGNKYALINNVMPLSEAAKKTAPKLRNPKIEFFLEDPETFGAWQLLGKFDKERIGQSNERKLIKHLLDADAETDTSEPETADADQGEDAPY